MKNQYASVGTGEISLQQEWPCSQQVGEQQGDFAEGVDYQEVVTEEGWSVHCLSQEENWLSEKWYEQPVLALEGPLNRIQVTTFEMRMPVISMVLLHDP